MYGLPQAARERGGKLLPVADVEFGDIEVIEETEEAMGGTHEVTVWDERGSLLKLEAEMKHENGGFLKYWGPFDLRTEFGGGLEIRTLQ